MKYPLPDLYDRASIEELKFERANANNKSHRLALSAGLSEQTYVPKFFDALKEINGKIWDLESDIRRGREGILGLEEVGRRALEIRNLNAQRILIKNEIAQHFGEFGENKYNHASENQN